MPHALSLDGPALVERAKRGDGKAFALLYRLHVRYVASVLHKLMPRDIVGELDDVIQDTFADAYVGLPGLRNPGGFRPWIARIAVRCAYDRLAQRRRLKWLYQTLEWMFADISDTGEREAADALSDLMESLPPALRLPWFMHVIQGRTFEEVARACGVSVSTAKRRIAEARARHREQGP